MLAVLNSLRCCFDHDIVSFVIYCDSQYVVNGFNDWMYGWNKKNWVRGYEKHPIPNADLWKELFEIRKEFQQCELKWVRGHNGNKWSEYADELINREMALKLQ